MNQLVKTFALFFASLFLIVTIQLHSCKKVDNLPNPDPNPASTDSLCVGNGETNYFPLKTGDKWEYSVTGSASYSNEVTGTIIIAGKTYFKMHYSDPLTSFDNYYRMDSSMDIYTFYETDQKEYLYIPANPTPGQIVASYVSGASRKVTDTYASVSTSDCAYEGTLKIEDLLADGSNRKTSYYKKGLGLVQEIMAASLTGSLSKVNIK